jgi:hypothetical protein
MPTYQTSDTESNFNSNIDRLFKLIRNVLNKGQYTNAEKYVRYLFDVLVAYHKKKSLSSKLDMPYDDFFLATSDTGINKIEPVNKKSLFEDHKMENYTRGNFEEKLTDLISEQIRPSNYKVFTFFFNLLNAAIGKLFSNETSIVGGSQLIREIKFITDRILFFESSIPNYEQHWFLHQTYSWFTELYSSSIIDSIDKIVIIEGEIREILRLYIDNSKLDLFLSFLESLSTRWLSSTIAEDELLNKYKPNPDNNFDTSKIKLINPFLQKANELQDTKKFFDLIKAFEAEIDQSNFGNVEKEQLKKEVGTIMLTHFKIEYLNIIVLDAIAYSLYKKNFSFFEAYLNYHNPIDSDSIWMNKSFNLKSFKNVIPFLEDYQKLMGNKFFWINRHDITLYINTILAYYILTEKKETVINYLLAIDNADVISTVLYNLHNIREKNLLESLPEDIIDKTLADVLTEYIETAEKRRRKIDERETRELPIDNNLKTDFFAQIFNEFERQSVARSIFTFYNQISNADLQGTNFGINQLFPRKAFIKQNNTFFINNSPLGNYLADNETTFIFSKIERHCKRIQINPKELDNYIKLHTGRFDILISGSYSVKSYFPATDFQESWSIGTILNGLPGFLGILNNNINVFWSPQSYIKGFLLLNSKKLGTLINCVPPPLDDNAQTYKQFRYSFIDFKDNNEDYKNIQAKYPDEDIKSQVWIRIFEKVEINISEKFEGIYIELEN